MDGHKIFAGVVWSALLSACNIGYIAQHSFDAVAFGFELVALLPAWAFLAKDFNFKGLGFDLKISTLQVTEVVDKAKASAPESIEQAEAQIALAQKSGDIGALPASPRAVELRTADNVVSVPIASLAPALSMLEDEQQQASLRDPNLALVSLRIDIERRLRTIAKMLDIRVRNLRQLVSALYEREIFNEDFVAVLFKFIEFGNQAAHGAFVEPAAASEILSGRRIVLDTLDTIANSVGAAKMDRSPKAN